MVSAAFLDALADVDQFFQTPMPICEWAEGRIVVRNSQRAGRLRLDPYQREPLAMAMEPGIQQVTKMFSSQTGKTLIDAIGIAYIIDQRPMPMMYMHATGAGITKFIGEKLDPVLKANPEINAKVRRNNRDILPREGFYFAGDFYCTLATARSMTGKHGTTARFIIADEIDDYMGQTMLSSLVQRGITYEDSRVLASSTPSLSNPKAQVYVEYLDGSQSYFYVPCPHCGESILILWENIDGQWLVCSKCDKPWTEGERRQAIMAGDWFETTPNSFHKSYWLPQTYSLNVSIQKTIQTASKYSHAERSTQVMAWPYEEDVLPELNAEMIKRVEPDWAVRYVAVGVDVQGDRIEYAVWQFDENLVRKHLRRWGVIARTMVAEEVFLQLRQAVAPFRPMRISIDGSYDFDWVNQGMRLAFRDMMLDNDPPVEIVRGYTTPSFGKPLRGAKARGYLWGAVDEGKKIFHRDVHQGLVSFHPDIPSDKPYDAIWQLMAERLVRVDLNTKTVEQWRRVDRRPNELLDMTIYAYIGVLGIDRTLGSGPALALQG